MQQTQTFHNQLFAPSAKILACVFLGSAVTFAIFLFMVSLLDGPARVPDAPKEYPIVEILQPKEPTKVIEKAKPVPPKVPPRPQQRPQVAAEPVFEGPGTIAVTPDVPAPSTQLDAFPSAAQGAARPLVRVPPQYPPQAAREGIEGFVVLRYDISATGAVMNAEVIDSEPKRIFDRHALKALRKWKFNPMLDNGGAQVQRNQQVRLDFNSQQ